MCELAKVACEKLCRNDRKIIINLRDPVGTEFPQVTTRCDASETHAHAQTQTHTHIHAHIRHSHVGDGDVLKKSQNAGRITVHIFPSHLIPADLISSEPSGSECAVRRPSSPLLRPVKKQTVSVTYFRF